MKGADEVEPVQRCFEPLRCGSEVGLAEFGVDIHLADAVLHCELEIDVRDVVELQGDRDARTLDDSPVSHPGFGGDFVRAKRLVHRCTKRSSVDRVYRGSWVRIPSRMSWLALLLAMQKVVGARPMIRNRS